MWSNFKNNHVLDFGGNQLKREVPHVGPWRWEQQGHPFKSQATPAAFLWTWGLAVTVGVILWSSRIPPTSQETVILGSSEHSHSSPHEDH